MTPVEFTHLTLKRPVCVTRELVLAFWSADSMGSGTYIIASGGAIVPVAEKPEDVKRKIYGTQTVETPSKGKQEAKRRA